MDGGKEGGRVPGVDPGPLHVLHDPGHHDLLPVREGVHVQLYGPLQEAVQEDGGPLLQGGVDFLQVALKLPLVPHHLHGPPPQDVARADEEGEAHLRGEPQGLLGALGHPALGLGDPEPLAEGVEGLPVLRLVDGAKGGAEEPDPGLLQALGELQGGLPPQGGDDPDGLLVLHDVEDVLQGQGLKVEAVGGVVVGGDGLRVGVHHDGLKPRLLQGPDGVDRGVVKLHPLPDPYGPRAQDHHLGLLRGPDLVLQLVGGVVVGGVGLKLGGAGVHCLVGGRHP